MNRKRSSAQIAISFGVLAYFTISHPLPNHCPVQWRITAREDALPPDPTAKRPMTERETPHEDFKTPHDQTANAPCPKQNAA